MKNCLLTKVKGSFANNNIPELDTIYLDLIAPEKRFAYGNLANERPTFTVYLNGGSVHIESQVDLYVNYSSETGVRSIDISDTKPHTYYLTTVNQLPNNALEKCIKITGDIYQIRNLYQGMVGCIFDFNESVKNSLKSMSYASNLIVYGGAVDSLDGITINPSTLILVLNMRPNNFSIDKLSQTSVAYIGSASVNTSTTGSTIVKAAAILNEITAANTNLRGIGFRCYGDVVNLPVNTRAVTEIGSGFAGNFADYYQRVRETRPEGKIAISALSTSTINPVIVGGQTLSYYVSQGQYVTYKDRYFVVITWDENGATVDKNAWDNTLQSAIDNCLIMS